MTTLLNVTLLLASVQGAVAAAAAPSAPLPSNESGQDLPSFEEFLERFNKSYSPEELPRRRALYAQAVRDIAALNARPGALWKAGVSRFADAAPEERPRARPAGARRPRRSRGAPAVPSESLAEAGASLTAMAGLPKSVDWRGTPGKIRDEADCGACWAIAAASALESHIFIATRQRVDVSEEAIVECTYGRGNTCTNGGTLEDAFMGAVKQGIASAASYPFLSGHNGGHPGRCKLGHGVAPVAGITGYVEVEANNPSALMHAVAFHGPIAVGVDASKHWDYYTGGILDTCDDHHMVMDHDVLLIGYGEEHGVKYWLVQNGWGTDWGEGGGYMRIRRHGRAHCGRDSKERGAVDCGECGILTDPSYPTGVYLRPGGGRHHGDPRHGRGSCAAYSCGGYDSSHNCQCNHLCSKYGNCCPDYQARCHHRRLAGEENAPILV